jgi:dTDP-4-dehydrorhamnose 3,5-epimerase
MAKTLYGSASDVMQIEKTTIEGVVVFAPSRFGDDRGWFVETWNAARMAGLGYDVVFVQDNHSMSAQIGTVRGLHYQRPPHAQDKLVRCSLGVIFDVAVDVRLGSPSYGRWFGVELSAENGKQLLVPKGCLHGFATRSPLAEVQYKCSDIYAPECDGAVRWNDPTLGIDWGLDGAPILSAKDAVAPLFSDFVSPFVVEVRS